MTCGLRSLRWLWLTFASVMLLVAAMPALAQSAVSPPVFSIGNVTVSESAGSAIITIRKSAPAYTYSKVEIRTIDGTAKAGSDYQPIDVVLTFKNSELAKTVSIPIINDSIAESSESFTIQMLGKRFANANTSATITITDDDAPPPPASNPCFDVQGSSAPFPVPGSNCPAKMCPGVANPVPAEQQCPTVTSDAIPRISACQGSGSPDPIAAHENFSVVGTWWKGAWTPLSCIAANLAPSP